MIKYLLDNKASMQVGGKSIFEIALEKKDKTDKIFNHLSKKVQLIGYIQNHETKLFELDYKNLPSCMQN